MAFARLSIASFAVSLAFALSASEPLADLDSRLDKGGAVYLQLDGRESFQAWGSQLENLASFLEAASPKAASRDSHRLFRGLLAAYRVSGLADVDAFGFSSLRQEDGLYLQKTVLRCPPEKADGFLWKAFGRKPESLAAPLSALPPSTSFAVYSCFDAKAFRAAVKALLSKEGATRSLNGLESFEAQAKASGFDMDAALACFDGELAFALCLDYSKPFPLPLPLPPSADPSRQAPPSPGFAFFAKVKDDSLLKMICESDKGLKPTSRDGAALFEAKAKSAAPSLLQVSLGQKGPWLFLASSPSLADSIIAAIDGGPSLSSTDAFKRLAKGVPLEGEAFVYYDGMPYKELSRVASSLSSFLPKLGQGVKLMELSGLDGEFFKVASQASPSLIHLQGRSKGSGPSSLSFAQGLLPVLATAGAWAPASKRAFADKAARNDGETRLKTLGLVLRQYSLDHGGAFPVKSGAEGIETLRTEGYVGDEELFKGATSVPRPRPRKGEAVKEASLPFVYLGGFSSSSSPDAVVAFEKPEEHEGFVNALFADGHVRGLELDCSSPSEFAKLYVERFGEGMSESVKREFLEKALLYEMANGR